MRLLSANDSSSEEDFLLTDSDDFDDILKAEDLEPRRYSRDLITLGIAQTIAIMRRFPLRRTKRTTRRRADPKSMSQDLMELMRGNGHLKTSPSRRRALSNDQDRSPASQHPAHASTGQRSAAAPERKPSRSCRMFFFFRLSSEPFCFPASDLTSQRERSLSSSGSSAAGSGSGSGTEMKRRERKERKEDKAIKMTVPSSIDDITITLHFDSLIERGELPASAADLPLVIPPTCNISKKKSPIHHLHRFIF